MNQAEEEHCPGRHYVELQLQAILLMGSSAEMGCYCSSNLSVV